MSIKVIATQWPWKLAHKMWVTLPGEPRSIPVCLECLIQHDRGAGLRSLSGRSSWSPTDRLAWCSSHLDSWEMHRAPGGFCGNEKLESISGVDWRWDKLIDEFNGGSNLIEWYLRDSLEAILLNSSVKCRASILSTVVQQCASIHQRNQQLLRLFRVRRYGERRLARILTMKVRI